MPAGPASVMGDKAPGLCVHIVLVPAGPSLVPTPLPHPFNGIIDGNLSSTVNVMGMPAATIDSIADNTPPHIPTPPGVSFQKPPSNKATIKIGSQTVNINGKAAARNGDIAETCNDPTDLPIGTVIAVGTVLIG